MPILTDDIPWVSPSQLEVYMECPQQWEYSYVELLKKKAPTKVYFDIGNYFHELSHVYYQLLREGRKAGDSFVIDYMKVRIRKDLQHLLEQEDYTAEQKLSLTEVLNRVSKMWDNFVKQQSPKIDSGIIVMEVEKHVQHIFTTPKGRQVILHGIVDLIYRDRSGKLRIRDHKTGEKANSWNQKKVTLLAQLLFYAIVYEAEVGSTVNNVEISFINSYDYKKEPGSNAKLFDLFPHEHNDAALANGKNNILLVVDKMLDGEPYRRLNSDCSNCQFHDLCDRELRGFNSQDLKRTYYTKVSRDHATSPFNRTGAETATEKNTGNDNPSKESGNFVFRWNGIGTQS